MQLPPCTPTSQMSKEGPGALGPHSQSTAKLPRSTACGADTGTAPSLAGVAHGGAGGLLSFSPGCQTVQMS